MPVRCLSLHADYVCHKSGACCTSGWPIHVESDRLPAWRGALADGTLTFEAGSAGDGLPLLATPDLPPGAGAVLRTRASGACVFYRERDGLCAVQRGLGHASLPVACQHFPRRCLIESDRIAVSLSHYCPTVARLAFREDLDLAIVQAPDALIGHIELEGLDARETMPPLLRPDLLADRETYRAWEQFVIGVLGLDLAPERALARISALTEALRTWKPGDGGLRERLDELVRNSATASDSAGVGAVSLDDDFEFEFRRREIPLRPLEGYEAVIASVPDGVPVERAPEGFADLDATFVAPAWPAFSRPLRQFLAAHAFGNWCAYNGRGLRTVVRSLEVALQVARVEAARACARAERALDGALLLEAFRAADLLLVHLADPVALGERLSGAEQD